jgi:hypothetical protein
LFRDIWAFWWLKNHPEDFLTVSKVLWHRDLKSTLRKYGSKFIESQALVLVEEELDRQGRVPGHLTHPEEKTRVEWGAASSSMDSRLQPWMMQALLTIASKDDKFEALPPAAKQNELAAIVSVIEAHPWLAKLLGANSRKNAVGTAQASGVVGIRGKSVA